MNSYSHFKPFVRRGLCAAILVGLAGSSISVWAQETDTEDDLALEEVIVTGSRIVRDGYSSSSPLAVFDEADINLAGNSSVDEFLKYIPQFTGYQMGKSTNNGSATGQTKIDVRGLGFNRTLVLINGRRTIGDATGDGAVDINTIPQAMIQRVEVLTDGASSVYGSDAIAGVVNFILYDEFDGLRITGDWGAGTQDWDAENYSLELLSGISSDRGDIVYSMGWYKQDELLQGDRAWAYDALYPQLQPDGTFKAVGSGSSNSRRIRVPGNGNWIYDSALGMARPFESDDVYNYAPVNALTQPNERYQFATRGRFNITDNMQAFFEGEYTRRTSQQRLAPDASFAVVPDIETPNNGAQYNDYVPANNPYNPFGSVNCANSLGLCDIGVRINRRFVESGGRLFAQKADQYRMVFGLRGEVKDWFNWDAAYTYAETQTADETKNYGRFDRWAIAVDPDACAADAACPGVLDPFGDYGSITPEQMSYLTTGSLKDIYNSTLQIAEINLTGEFGELSGGSVGWAAGYMHRRERGSYSPDEFKAAGLTTGGAGDPLDGGFGVDEIYGEFLLPVTSALSFDASFRWSDYDSVDGSKTTWKLGGDWAIVESFRLRGTVGTGFRAPNIAELNTQGAGTFPLMNNPCELADRALAAGDITQTTYDNCKALGMNTTDSGELGFAWQSYQEYVSTGNLQPETSNQYTIGFVWDIDVADGLTLSADWWHIKVDDVIGVPGANALFNTCLASENLSSPACSADIWNPLVFEPDVPGDAYTDYGNLGTLETDGIDFSGTFNSSFSNGLGFRARADLTWLNSYKSGTNVGTQVEQAGTADGFAVFPEWKATVDFGIAGSVWTTDLIFRYFSKCDDLWRPPSTTADAVAEATLYTDLVGTYTWNQFNFTVGINNLFDVDPPYFHSAFNANTEPGLYDVIGRRLFVTVAVDF